MSDPGLDRPKLLEDTGRDPARQERGKLGPELVEFGRRAAMRWPVDPSLRPAATGTPEARQPDRDRAEYGGHPAASVVFDPACGSAASAARPLGGMVSALRGDDRLLNAGQKLLALRERQTQIREIAQITGAVKLQNVNAARRTLGPTLHQAQNPSDKADGLFVHWSPTGTQRPKQRIIPTAAFTLGR
jgi:hypothetical protein